MAAEAPIAEEPPAIKADGSDSNNSVIQEGRSHKHIKLRLPFERRNDFMMAVPQGLMVRLYAPQQLDPNQWVDPDEVNITVVANANEPDPQYRRHQEDIDQYLATINTVDSRIRILSDTVTTNEQPNLIQKNFVKNTVILDHPGLDDRDDLRSKAANKRRIEMTESQVSNLEQRYDKEKKDFIRTKLKDIEETDKEHPITGEKIFTVEQGEI